RHTRFSRDWSSDVCSSDLVDGEVYLGPGRADLLEAIAARGSISAAGKSMGMSYKRAWDLVQALNTGFGAPLVETERGGAGQGGEIGRAACRERVELLGVVV